MHYEAMKWVQDSFNEWFFASEKNKLDVLEFGSLNINGSVKPIFEPYANTYFGIDMQEGPGVDMIADAASFDSEILYDVIVCAEVFEHTPAWKEIVNNAHRLLKVGGVFIATMAGVGRTAHSAVDGLDLRDWEHYANITEDELSHALISFNDFKVDYTFGMNHPDIRCFAVK